MKRILFSILSLLLLTKAFGQTNVSCNQGQLNFGGSCVSIYYVEYCSQYHIDNSCHQCEYGYSLSNGRCIQANTTTDCCQSYNTDGSCLQCSSGLSYKDPYCIRNTIFGCILKQNGVCVTCGNGLTLRKNQCFPNVDNCLAYNDSGQCSQCQSGYSLINSYCVQYVQVPNCRTQNLYGCVDCNEGYYLTANRTCVAYQPGCLRYWREKCLACHYRFQLINGQCLIFGCLSYVSDGCGQCQSNYTLEKGICSLNNCLRIQNGSCIQCKSSYRLSGSGCVSPINYQCQSCAFGYTFANNTCIRVITGCIIYNGSICASCNSNFLLTISGTCQIYGCQSYSNNGCTSCQSPFQLSNFICVIQGCQVLGPNGCKVCNGSFYLNGNICFKRDPLCLNYGSNSLGNVVCVSCADHYFLNGSSCCVKKNRGCIYDQNGHCNSCMSGFTLTDIQKCQILGCNQYDSNDQCSLCSSPFKLNSSFKSCSIPYCLSYKASGCVSCQSGYILVNNLCVQGDIYCLSYNSTSCLQCQQSFNLDINGKCAKNIPHCLKLGADRVSCFQCESGFIASGGICKPFLSNCKSEDNNTLLCLECFSGFHLYQGLCILNDPNCLTFVKTNYSQICSVCQAGYLLDKNNKCVQKAFGCIYNNFTCNSCISPFQYDQKNQKCYVHGCQSHCSSGCSSCLSYFNLTNGDCVINNCQTYGLNECLTCNSGYTFNNGSCVILDVNCIVYQNGKCSQCKGSYQLYRGKCSIIDKNCDSYDQNASCLKCKQYFHLSQQKICETNQNGCVYEAGLCKYCTLPFVLQTSKRGCHIPNCLETNSSGCLSCKAPFVLSSDTNECIISNCQRIQNNECVVCDSSYHLVNKACVINNPNCKFYGGDGTCQICINGTGLCGSGDCNSQVSQQGCLQKSSQDASKCLACSDNYFLNRFFQCEKKDGYCVEYLNGVCSECSLKYFLYNGICFPYTPGCVKYQGKDCVQCINGWTLKSGDCFNWTGQGLKLQGADDTYDFEINPIDVRQSKYYIDNLSPASAIGKLFFSSSFDSTYQDASLTSDEKTTGKGWKAQFADTNQFIGFQITGQPVTFYAVQLESVEGNYITEFYIEYSSNGVDFIKVQNSYKVSQDILTNIVTIYFTGIYAQSMRIRISAYSGWPACRIQLFYYDSLRFKKISNLKSLKYLEETIDSNYVDRVDNQLYINQMYFFNPTASCSEKDLCFTGLQLCQQRNITQVILTFANSTDMVNSFYLTYSIDGRNFNCYESCVNFPVTNVANNSFSLAINDLIAQQVRIYPTKYVGSPLFSPTFFYS